MKINNIHLVLSNSPYEFEVNNPIFLDTVGLFCSENPTFGGYSFSFAHSIYKMLVPENVNRITTYTMNGLNNSNIEVNRPYIITTPVIPNNRDAAKNLMSEILAFCSAKKLDKIILTHFIYINQNRHAANMQGILDSLYRNELEHELTVVLTIDEIRFDSFESIINNYNNT